MKHFYQVTHIEFDFDGEDLSEEVKDCITYEAKETLWDSPTEDDLVDTISDVVGYCIKSIDSLDCLNISEKIMQIGK
jgi:hypothetical protein